MRSFVTGENRRSLLGVKAFGSETQEGYSIFLYRNRARTVPGSLGLSKEVYCLHQSREIFVLIATIRQFDGFVKSENPMRISCVQLSGQPCRESGCAGTSAASLQLRCTTRAPVLFKYVRKSDFSESFRTTRSGTFTTNPSVIQIVTSLSRIRTSCTPAHSYSRVPLE